MKLNAEVIAKVFKLIELKKAGMPEGAQAVLDSIKDTLSEEQWALVEMMLAGAAPMPIEAIKPEPVPEEKPVPEKNPEEAMAKFAKEHPAVAAEIALLKKRATDAETEAKATKESLEKSQKQAAEEIQKGRVARFTKLAETELKLLQGKPEELAKRLCDLEDMLDAKEFGEHITMLKAANAQLEKSGAFKPVGTSGAEAGSASAEVFAKATELRKTNPKLSEAQARARVMKDRSNVELMKRYREERSAAN